MAREVEIKFQVEDVAALQHRLQAASFRCATPRTHEMNVLYDRRGHPLRRRGELLRLRKFGDTWRLTHKARGSSRVHKSREETETVVGDGAQMEAILHALGYQPAFRYEKYRSEWSDGQGHVVVDETPIGNFAEIEGEPAWIDATAASLGVPRSAYIMKNYAELFTTWKRRTRRGAREMTFAECKCQ